MPTLKLVLLVAGIALAVFAWLLWYAVSPTVRDVSDYAAVRGLLNQPLTLRQPAFLHLAEPGQYQLRNTVLTPLPDIIGRRLAVLPVGTPFTLREFKRYTNGVVGSTHLVALGETKLPTGEPVTFEYDWGSIDLASFTRESADLPLAAPLWEPAR